MTEGSARLGVSELLVGVAFPPILLEVLRFAIPNEHLEELVYRSDLCRREGFEFGFTGRNHESGKLARAGKGSGTGSRQLRCRQSSPANVNSANPLSSKLYDLTESRAPESWINGARRKPAL